MDELYLGMAITTIISMLFFYLLGARDHEL